MTLNTLLIALCQKNTSCNQLLILTVVQIGTTHIFQNCCVIIAEGSLPLLLEHLHVGYVGWSSLSVIVQVETLVKQQLHSCCKCVI